MAPIRGMEGQFLFTSVQRENCFKKCELDPLIDALKARNPFGKKSKVSTEENEDAEQFDRDNINVPVLVAEKRGIIISDPGLSNQRLGVKQDDEMVLTMKKVSSLALV